MQLRNQSDAMRALFVHPKRTSVLIVLTIANRGIRCNWRGFDRGINASEILSYTRYFYYIIFFFLFFFFFLFSFTELLIKLLPRFFNEQSILLVVMIQRYKSKCQSQRNQKGVALQLFPRSLFYFPYCSDQLITLSTFVHTEYCFLPLPKLTLTKLKYNLSILQIH